MCCLASAFASAATPDADWLDHRLSTAEAPAAPDWDRAVALNAAVIGGFLAYGAVAWDYGTHRPRSFDEGWFSAHTLHGGMDKLGHAYSTYVTATLFGELYREFGFASHDAALLGAGSAWTAMLLVEVGDSFAESHGFSTNDVIANSAGALFSYLRMTQPTLRDSLDLRLSWWPSPAFQRGEVNDFSTDYSGQTWHLVGKGRALGRALDIAPLEFLELHLTYRARGYEPTDRPDFPRRERELGIALSLDLTWLLHCAAGTRLGNVLEFYQPPHTTVGLWDRQLGR